MIKPINPNDAVNKEYVDKICGENTTPNSVDFISKDEAMNYEEPNGNKIYVDKVSDHRSRAEINGYDLTTQLTTDEDGNQKVTFTLEKDGDFSEKELRFFEIGLKKSVGGYDPYKKRIPNHSKPQRRYSRNNPHPNYNNHHPNREW
jgi:hypothetical protein